MLIPRYRFGIDCIYNWLAPGDGKNTCPMCRSELFELDHSGWTDDDEDLEEEELVEAHIRWNAQLLPSLAPILDEHSPQSLMMGMRLLDAEFHHGEMVTSLGLSYSHQVFALFRLYRDLQQHASLEQLFPGRVLGVCQLLRRLMGALYIVLESDLTREELPSPWKEDGPRITDLLDYEGYGETLACGMIYFLQTENRFAGHRLRHPMGL